MMAQEGQPVFKRVIIIFVSYIAVLQVLYALQSILVSVPVVATVTTFYVLIYIRTSKPILNSAGSQIKTNTTHERDLQNLLVQTEEILQTNLHQFHKVIYSREKKNFVILVFFPLK
jgi:hypothetical protein